MKRSEIEQIEKFYREAPDEEMYRYFMLINGGALPDFTDLELISIVKERPKKMYRLEEMFGALKAKKHGRMILRELSQPVQENRHPRTARLLGYWQDVAVGI